MTSRSAPGHVITLDGIDDGGLDLDVQGAASAPSGARELHVNGGPGRRRGQRRPALRGGGRGLARASRSAASSGPARQRGLQGGGMKARPGSTPPPSSRA